MEKRLNKKSLSFLVYFFIIISLPSFAFSQDDDFVSKIPSNHEIYIGYGGPTSPGLSIMGNFAGIFAAIFTGGQSVSSIKSPGISQAGYNWFFTDKLAVGGLITFEPYKVIYDSTSNQAPSKNGLLSFQASFKVQYGWEYVRLYHGLSAGLGLTISENSSPSPSFTFNLIPIGIKIGKEQGFNFFADVGLWSTAFINAGVSYRF